MKKYKVTTSVTGDNLDRHVQVFKEQVSLRPGLEDSEVYSEGSGKLIIEADIEGYSKEEVIKLASEQIWELCSAILKDLNPLDVEVGSVEDIKE